MKKLLCIAAALVFTVMLGVSVFAAEPPRGVEVRCEPALPEGQYLCVQAEYAEDDPQYEMMVNYLAQEGIAYTGMDVMELAIWDDSTSGWISDDAAVAQGTEYTITLPIGGDLILHNSSMTGGVERLSGTKTVKAQSFGMFAVVYTGGGVTNVILWIVCAVVVVAIIIIVILGFVGKGKKTTE